MQFIMAKKIINVICGKSFSEAEILRKHINAVHNGQKYHKCDSCGKAFSISGNFVKHISFIYNFPS